MKTHMFGESVRNVCNAVLSAAECRAGGRQLGPLMPELDKLKGMRRFSEPTVVRSIWNLSDDVEPKRAQKQLVLQAEKSR